ncbi:hypothetical protein Athai_38630 [Actinocatenispora thailandica]|uniref:Uncharacterized protein n=1 Tax=Actinocatenispora thailandica TaxID=227318 RepID=A0A7R7DR40_9ACTN|nr:hypothetical protein Athai_38630 [Actinocatenispora thailandica]
MSTVAPGWHAVPANAAHKHEEECWMNLMTTATTDEAARVATVTVYCRWGVSNSTGRGCR